MLLMKNDVTPVLLLHKNMNIEPQLSKQLATDIEYLIQTG